MKKDFYTRKIFYSETESCFLCEILELGGCTAEGETAEEAVENSYEAARQWITDAVFFGYDVKGLTEHDKL